MCLHSKRAQEIMAVQWFCQRMVRVVIYQAPSINFSNTNDGHESCYMLTAPFLTNVDLCIHLEWLICSCFKVAYILHLSWHGDFDEFWLFLGGYWSLYRRHMQQETRQPRHGGLHCTVWWANHYNLPSFMAVILSIWHWWLDLEAVLDLWEQEHVILL